MVLQTGGSISLSNLAAEFIGSTIGPIKMSYFRPSSTNGARGVPAVSNNGSLNISSFYGKRNIIVPAGLIAKYSGDTLSNGVIVDETYSGNNPISSAGSVSVTRGHVSMRNYISGNTSSRYILPNFNLTSVGTILLVDRYNSTVANNRQRIVSSSQANVAIGHLNNGGSVYALYNNGQIYNSGYDIYANTWETSVYSLGNYFRGNQITYSTQSNYSSLGNLGVNVGYSGSSTSDWAMYSMLVYNRNLSLTEIMKMEGYLNSIYSTQIQNVYNWYSNFTRTTGAPFAITQSGSDPNVQLQFTSSTIGSTYNAIYSNNIRLQDYQQFVVEFEYSTSNASADGIAFHFGGTGFEQSEIPQNNSGCLEIHTYGSSQQGKGIYLFSKNGTTLGNSIFDTTNIAWEKLSLVYTKGTSGTFKVYRNGTNIISADDPNNSSWVSTTSGNYYGFAGRTGGLYGDHFLRRVSITTSD